MVRRTSDNLKSTYSSLRWRQISFLGDTASQNMRLIGESEERVQTTRIQRLRSQIQYRRTYVECPSEEISDSSVVCSTMLDISACASFQVSRCLVRGCAPRFGSLEALGYKAPCLTRLPGYSCSQAGIWYSSAAGGGETVFRRDDLTLRPIFKR